MEEKTQGKLFGAFTSMSPEIYKDFYKIYYKERLKVFNIITSIIAVVIIIAGFAAYYNGFGAVWTVLALWIGAFLLFYPRMAYRKPYKRSRDVKQTTRFAFYDSFVREKINSNETDYNYSELMQVLETNKYFFIYHDVASVSIVDKENVKENADGLSALLRAKAPYKRIKG